MADSHLNDCTPPARACAESLVGTLGKRGAIVSYHAQFERLVIRGLADQFAALARPPLAIHDRVVDLEPVAKAHDYHRDMRGSFSIKAVLPTIAPELDYASLLEVQDGDMAQAAYIEAIQPGRARERKAELERALVEYCKRDTWAMVMVARGLVGEATQSGRFLAVTALSLTVPVRTGSGRSGLPKPDAGNQGRDVHRRG